jgi:hypothetical protein
VVGSSFNNNTGLIGGSIGGPNSATAGTSFMKKTAVVEKNKIDTINEVSELSEAMVNDYLALTEEQANKTGEFDLLHNKVLNDKKS